MKFMTSYKCIYKCTYKEQNFNWIPPKKKKSMYNVENNKNSNRVRENKKTLKK